jgi:hypothetical protein
MFQLQRVARTPAREADADRVASDVVNRMSPVPLVGSRSLGKTHDETSEIKSPSAGVALPIGLQGALEGRIGWSLRNVRIHVDEQAAAAAKSLRARAFTYGEHVFFAKNEFAPHRRSGLRLLAHELAHVRQQMTCGDRCVQLQAAGLDFGEAPSREVPDLSELTVLRAQQYLASGDWQAAIDVVVNSMVENGRIDRSLLAGGKVQFRTKSPGDGTTVEGGDTSGSGYRRVSSGALVAIPSALSIGKDGVSKGVAWLYSTILHEYQHVLQFTARAGFPTTATQVPGQAIDAHEVNVEAFAVELLQSERSGISRKPRLVQDLWELLQEDWVELSIAKKRRLNDLYVRAHAAALAAGLDPRLSFTPRPQSRK